MEKSQIQQQKNMRSNISSPRVTLLCQGQTGTDTGITLSGVGLDRLASRHTDSYFFLDYQRFLKNA